jgi:serine/threonine protein kinase
MVLAPGTMLGPYEVLAPLGAGGMGEVFTARDTRLGRNVAVKVLPESISLDSRALSRFESEAKAVAALSHPNILALFDVGEASGIRFAVMELLEGETLRQVMGGGTLPARQVVAYGAEIADGLAAAHAKGIVHRDLKPENVFVTKEGHIKILDFGLARHVAFLDGVDSKALTCAPERTEPGTVLGTLCYMSPEQVRGLTADHRSDIFALGAVLYEMASGRRAFAGTSAAETMVAILREDPPEIAGRGLQPGLDALVRHCLEKAPERRFQSASDIAFGLRNGLNLSEAETRQAPRDRAGRRLRPLEAVALLATGCALGAVAVWSLRPATPEPARIRPLTFSGADGEPSASPDGSMVAFTSTRDGVSRIWVKQVSGGEAPITPGPDRFPRFSPDGASVLFLREEGATLSAQRVPLLGGEPRKILDDVAEADWSPDGTRIAFLRSRIASSQSEWTLGTAQVQGGRETALAVVPGFLLHHARWSPDGRTIAVVKTTPFGFRPPDELLLVDASTGAVRPIIPARSRGPIGGLAWSGKGRAIVFGQAGHLLGDTSGAPAAVVWKAIPSGEERTLFWASDLFPTIGGSKQFATFDVLGNGRLVFDEIAHRVSLLEVPIGPGASARTPRVLTAGSSRDRQPVYSPDGEQILFSSNRSGNSDLWSLSTRSGALRQLTDDPAQDWDPGFSPDGKSVLWSSDRSGNLEIWIANADGSGARQLSRDGVDAENPTATRDGAWVVHSSSDPSKIGIWKIRTDGSGAARLVPGSLSNAEVSPDGRHATFLSLDLVRAVNTIGVVEIATGRVVPFQIRVPYRSGLAASRVLIGRTRWLPDGRAIAWIGEDKGGITGVFAQDFVPGQDTSATRRKLAGFSRDYVTESFGIAPDGGRLALATLTHSGRLMIAEGGPLERVSR